MLNHKTFVQGKTFGISNPYLYCLSLENYNSNRQKSRMLNRELIVYDKVFICHYNFAVAILTRSPTLSSNNKFDTIDKILYCYH